MILEIQANTRQIDNWLHTRRFQLLCITDATSLQDQWARKGASADDNLLARPESTGLLLLWGDRINNNASRVKEAYVGVKWFSRNGSNSNSNTVLDDDFVDFGVTN